MPRGPPWSQEETNEFMVQIISLCIPKNQHVPYHLLKMPGRSPRALKERWLQIRTDAAAAREKRRLETSEDNTATNESGKTPTKSASGVLSLGSLTTIPHPAIYSVANAVPRAASSPRSTRKRERKNYAEITGFDDNEDDEDEKTPSKKARLASDEEMTVIGSGSDKDNAVSTARNKPQAKARGGSRSTPVKKGIARRVKIEDTTDDDDPTFDGEV
ncbi:hypothetical protein F5Y04DRAFT_274715 [Hypomontagnella monticulosa]|nr:hypothetical protein F5Y04DRAFT_274715 [Hypomontagnella monticulosa]